MILFYVLALLFSWLGWASFAASQVGLINIVVVWEIPLLAQFGPTVIAFLLTGINEGKKGIKRLLGYFLKWKIDKKYYLISIFTVPAIAIISIIIHNIFGSAIPTFESIKSLPSIYAESFGGGGPYSLGNEPYPSMGVVSTIRNIIQDSSILALLNLVFFSLLTGPISEEFGWRGYLLPKMKKKYSPLKSSIIIGILWGFWHTGPDFWMMIFNGKYYAFLYPTAMTLGTILLSIIFTWLFINSKESLIPSILFHASFNMTLYILTIIWSSRNSLLIGGELLIGLLVTIFLLLNKSDIKTFKLI